MPVTRFLIRIVAFLLVPCLIVDPVVSAYRLPNKTELPLSRNICLNQALETRLAEFGWSRSTNSHPPGLRVIKIVDPAFWLGSGSLSLRSMAHFLTEIEAPIDEDILLMWELVQNGEIKNPDIKNPRIGRTTAAFRGRLSEQDLLRQYGFVESKRIALPNDREIVLIEDAPRHRGASRWIENLLTALQEGKDAPLEFNAWLSHERKRGFLPVRLFEVLTPEQQLYVFEHEKLGLEGKTHQDVVRIQGHEIHARMVMSIRTRILSH